MYIAGGADPVIEHCWITGNKATASSTGYGGGIACSGSGTEPVIDNNLIEDNTASTSWYGYGGGIYCNQLTMCEITNNTITDNVASTVAAGFGGGIFCSQSTVDITRNFFVHNIAAGPAASLGEGGGVYVYRGTVNIICGSLGSFTANHAAEGSGQVGRGGGIRTSGSGNIVIEGFNQFNVNIASLNGPGYGGGVYCGSGNTTIRSMRFWGNRAAEGSDPGDGGGLYLITYGGTVVQDTEFIGNRASVNGLGRGGAIYSTTSAEIDRNIFDNNVASDSSEGYGGGLYMRNATGLQFTNNTVYGNRNTSAPSGSGAASGLYHESGGSLTIANNIIAGHNNEDSDSLGMHFSLPTTIRNNCFHDNPGGHYNANVTSLEEVLADPRLRNPEFFGFELLYDSPCIDAGDPAFPADITAGWTTDIGWHEYTGNRHWRAVTGTGELLFGGNVKAKVNVTTLGTLSEIDIVVHPYEYHAQAPASVRRWYEIDHIGDGMTFDLTLTYQDHELDFQDEPNLALWRWTDSYHWDGPMTAIVDTLENTATAAGLTEFSEWVMTSANNPTGVRKARGRFQLFANYPNPFNPSTTIAYELAAPAHVDLAIYDLAGRLVRVLVDSGRSEGYHEVNWDGRDEQGSQVASGVYFCRIEAAGSFRTMKLVLLK
jgi:hypothetical protein